MPKAKTRGLLLSLETKSSSDGHCLVILEYSRRKSNLRLKYSRYFSHSSQCFKIKPVGSKPPRFSRATFDKIQKAVHKFYQTGQTERLIFYKEKTKKLKKPAVKTGQQYGLLF